MGRGPPVENTATEAVRRQLPPLGGAGPRVDGYTCSLCVAVQLGRLCLGYRGRGAGQLAHNTWLRAMRLVPKPVDHKWPQVRAAVRRWPALGGDLEGIVASLDDWAAAVQKATHQALCQWKASWGAWVRTAFHENSAAKVYRFIRPEVPASWIVGPADIRTLNLGHRWRTPSRRGPNLGPSSGLLTSSPFARENRWQERISSSRCRCRRSSRFWIWSVRTVGLPRWGRIIGSHVAWASSRIS